MNMKKCLASAAACLAAALLLAGCAESHAENYPAWIILSHFKGHAMAGFGGAIKNVGIGISSSSGKV